jgi:hypothetical protein
MMKVGRWIAFAAAILVPLLLLIDPAAIFHADWENHLWLVGYFGEYFRQHAGMPQVMNTTPVVGMSLPVFYGYLLYPSLGFFAAVMGANLAVRLGCVLVVATQFFALMTAGRATFHHRWISFTVAVSVIWSTYSLTNLYNRSAVAEYFANGFLVSAVAFAVAAMAGAPGWRSRFHLWMAGVCGILTIGAHPPTALIGMVFFLVLAGLALGRRQSVLFARGSLATQGVGLGVTVIGLVILSPWVYANIWLSRDLWIVVKTRTLVFYTDRCDSILARFAPFPLDLLSHERGTVGVSTPYLEAPINFVLLILLIWSSEFWRPARREEKGGASSLWVKIAGDALVAGTGLFVFFSVLSLSQSVALQFGFLAPYVQLVYRLVSFCNLALLIALLAAGTLAARRDRYLRHWGGTSFVLAVCLIVAAAGVGIKLSHAKAVEANGTTMAYTYGGARASLITVGSPDLARAYATLKFFRALTGEEVRDAPAVAFPVGTEGSNFASVGTVQVKVSKAGWVRTNATAFPWTKVTLNGEKLAANQLGRHGHLLAVQVPPGTSTLGLAWQSDPIWSILRGYSMWTFGLAMFITAIWIAANCLTSVRSLFVPHCEVDNQAKSAASSAGRE